MSLGYRFQPAAHRKRALAVTPRSCESTLALQRLISSVVNGSLPLFVARKELVDEKGSENR
jgi:hypothetical protein